MNKSQDFILYEKLIEAKLSGYQVEKKHFVNGDFGDLDQLEFNSIAMGGEIDFGSKVI